MQERQPILPCGYELEIRAHSPGVLDEACALAAAGAPEGTLLWARSQDDCELALRKRWHSGHDNLHLSIVFRPDADAPASLAQLALVACVALGAAVAEHAPPWMVLRYRWPNDIVVNASRFAAVHYRPGRGDEGEWAVVSVNANVDSAPEDPSLVATSLREAGCEVDVVGLLEGFSRHLLGWLDRWTNDGPGPVLRAWRARADDVGSPVVLECDGRRISGTFQGIDEGTGAALIDDAGTVLHLELEAYLRDGYRVPQSVMPPTT